MDSIQIISPLIGVVLGGILTGIGSYWRARADRKNMIARALSYLLEVRHHLVGIDVVLREINARFTVPEEATPVLRSLIDKLVPVDQEVHKRYEEAIALMAGIDPLLAFNMRAKNTVPNLLALIRELSATSGATPSHVESLETTLRSAVAPALDRAVLELAREHSFFTTRKVKKLMSAKGQVPPELEAFFNKVASLAVDVPIKKEQEQSN